jgi:hypothetical protein
MQDRARSILNQLRLRQDPHDSIQLGLNSICYPPGTTRLPVSSRRSALNSRSKSKVKENLVARIRLNLRNLSITEKLAKGRQIVTAMTNNASFSTPTPPLSEVTARLDDLDKAFASVQAARSELATRTSAMEAAEGRLNQALTQLAGYVESVAGKDDTVITSAGMEIKAAPSATTVPPAPDGVGATAGDHDGVIELFWKSVPNARSYVIESSTDPATATSWAHVGIATSASKAINNLTSGKRYWFRVAAVSAGGQSGWSEHATKVAP